jgi:hypothetical protein
MPGMHFDGSRACRFERICNCSVYRGLPNVPIGQLQQMSQDCAVIVVVAPVEDENWNASPGAYADIIAGDLTVAAHIVLVQEGPGLYFVNKHPERSLIGGSYTTEETMRDSLLALKEKYT